MEFNLASAKLTGNPGTSGWAQVYDFKPEESEKLEKRGQLLAVISTKKAIPESESLISGREIISRLHEEYFGNLEGTAFNTLKTAITKVIEEFKNSWGDIEIAAVASLKDVVYTAVGGGGQIGILRNGMLANILVSQSGGVVAASGFPKVNDILLVGTSAFFEIFSNGVIKAALEAGSPEAAIESFAPTLHSKKDTGNVGVIVLKFGQTSEFFPAKTAESGPQAAKPDFFETIKAKIKFPKISFPDRKIYIRRQEGEMLEPQEKKVMVSAGTILVILLLVSIGFGIRQKRIKEEKGRYEPKLIQAQHELDEAVSLSTLNPSRARELFSDSRALAEGLKSQGVKDPRLGELIKKLDQNQGTISGEYSAQPADFLDLSLQTSGFNGDEISSSGGKVYILDKNGKKIISVAIATKKTALVAGPDQLSGALGLASYEDRVFILNDSGIYEVGTKNSKVLDKDWAGEVLGHAYAGNFYVLDKSVGSIWRYAGVGDKFASRQNWLGPGVAPNFSSTVAMTIDGAIWVLGKNGSIQKFSLGSPQRFAISGLPKELTSADAIYTNEEQKYLYILDKSSKRILVADKDGAYKAQYVSDKLSEAKDIAVSEKDKKIIFLAGAKLYSIEIRHLE